MCVRLKIPFGAIFGVFTDDAGSNWFCACVWRRDRGGEKVRERERERERICMCVRERGLFDAVFGAFIDDACAN